MEMRDDDKNIGGDNGDDVVVIMRVAAVIVNLTDYDY